ncbi:TonB-dependent receptor [Emticicia sp. 21SJ11W-3]|uniref:TonB-dependent receptor n=1 Tax=Emticicia sp. 21SJ11W-3 TaxID=2916755 RepID=UPI00209CADCF|nr:TonB-dependent receptor [Emticicia sp. 21SJ11W-3]UTA66210.1 TonB-dependent receptor [Emticicia sp. 21SJ11W-3]
MKFKIQTHIKNIYNLLIITSLGLVAMPALAQLDDDVVITKDRKVELPPANRVFEKIPALKPTSEEKTMRYTFFDRKPKGVEEVKFNPNVVAPEGTKNNEELETYNNYATLGAGNYGRLLGEVFLNSNQENNLIIGVHAYHNSTARGPVDDKNSSNMYSKAEITGKYLAEKFQLNAGLNYNRDQYYFYGYQRPREDLDRKDIRQVLNTVQFNVGFENTAPNARVDYGIKTYIRSLKNIYEAQETDWGSSFRAYFPIITEKFVAGVDAEAYVTQRTDDVVDKRNLFRVTPTFKLNFRNFGANIGFKAVNEFDEVKKINRTMGFPMVELIYKHKGMLFFYAGLDGDIIRNTLGSMLNENPYLKSRVSLLNTEKNKEIYIGTKGDLSKGLSYNLRAATGNYKNLYFFNNYSPDFGDALGDTAKFNILYETESTRYYNVTLQLNYQLAEVWRTNLKVDYNNYETKAYEKPFHRPAVITKWGNSFFVTDKFLANLDLYYFGKTFAKNPTTDAIVTNKDIVDVNTEFDYLFSKQFTAFVKLNNLLGRKYERFLYYPQQGLNFLVGVNFSF